MKKIKLLFLLGALSLSLGISSCDEEETEEEETLSASCLTLGTGLTTSAEEFEANQDSTHCGTWVADMQAFLDACETEVQAYITAGAITQEEYDSLKIEFDNIDCSIFPN